jgi:hypothetical protein
MAVGQFAIFRSAAVPAAAGGGGMAFEFFNIRFEFSCAAGVGQCALADDLAGGIARENGMKALQIGGMPDHVHLALALPPTQTVSKALQLLKGGSSKWIKDAFPNVRGFAWQDGYAAFCVSKSNCRRSLLTFKTSANIIEPNPFTKNSSRFSSGTLSPFAIPIRGMNPTATVNHRSAIQSDPQPPSNSDSATEMRCSIWFFCRLPSSQSKPSIFCKSSTLTL